MKKGLVMEGGAMRGMFTCGVIDVFMESGIEFDGAIGVSAGATFGCNIKSRQIGRPLRYNKKYMNDKRYCSMSSLLKTGNLFNAEFCYKTLPRELDPYDAKAFYENPLKFYLVATDCETGKAIVHDFADCDTDRELDWIRASASMPLCSKPVEVDGLKLLDGGMSDSIPLKAFEDLGYDRNIVILTQPREYVKKPNKMFFLMKLFLRKYPNLLKTMKNRHNMYNEETKYVFDKADKGEVLVICPEKSLGIGRLEKNPDELERCYQEGRKAALTRLDDIKNFLR